MSFQAIGTGSGILGYRPCWCPSPFPLSPSISRCFSIHSSSPAIRFHTCFTVLFLLYDRCICTYSPYPLFAYGKFRGLGLALVPDIVTPEVEHGVRMMQKSRFKFLPGPGFEPRARQSNGFQNYHKTYLLTYFYYY